ncbi:hypothetical protein COU02_00420 [bacterium (Candidatus Gribaldobacteria) CG10_big_fil_rev_8_21_14_0_10_37_46]|uniref:DUF4349 domain-containing protein n=1 Tax=bacterium (Candidatus Gribaldobacteria) CG10_big_fil_rev_8_21_14_0_10_37_46 TaxID=2014276 RepID=A0A2H0UX58_9BACT|nr:MAG: hypothetical protein COU02_00420 [bacterium (Candidatus Gribaldobacteria) CG10_big_fil_rev_8_21_14_0_10_37_46]
MIPWIKKNLLTIILTLVVVFLLVRNFRVQPLLQTVSFSSLDSSVALKSAVGRGGAEIMPINEVPPTTNPSRMVVLESNMSLVVKNVKGSVDKLIEKAKAVGGYMISSSLSQPEEAPFATVSLRIPAKDLKTTLDYFRSLSIKVFSENLTGYDVTDRYTDIEARLATLNQTKAKFEEILRSAVKIQDILEVQRQIISLQDQIDSLKGQQLYLEKTAELSRVTVYLSTDEFALPYAPATPFKPATIFKLAVRALVSVLRFFVKALIWVVVFSVLWLPILLVIYFVRKARSKKRK